MMYGNGITKFQRWQRPKQHQKHDSSSPNKPATTVLDALTQKQNGEFETAIQLLTIIASSNTEEAELARYELALLYAQLGKEENANAQLNHLHFKYRLSPSILVSGSTHSEHLPSHMKKTPKTVMVKAVDNVLPPTLLQHLQRAFHAGSPFFTEHSYPTEQFFSYNINLQQSTDGATTLMHQVATHIRPIIEATFPHKFLSSSSESVEFWCHARDASSSFAHQMHFDLDEEALRQAAAATTSKTSKHGGGRNVISKSRLHPLVSCVLYLSEHDTTEGQRSCAPTLVTDQTLDDGSVASEGWLCYPALNRLLMFDGSCLHGIVPHLSVTQGSSTPRVTLMLGWWGKTFDTTTPHSTKMLGPNMPLPSWNVHRTWPRLLEAMKCKSKDTKTKTNQPMTNASIVHLPGPIWTPVPTNDHHVPTNDHHKEAMSDATDAVEFISIAELNALRDKNQNHHRHSFRTGDSANVGIPQSNPTAPSQTPVLALWTSDEVDRTSNHLHPTKKQKNNYSNVRDKIQRNDDQLDEDEEAVEFVSMSVLQQLRKNKNIPLSLTDQDQKVTSDCSGVVGSGGYVFVGKWFIKSLSEIRDDVLQGGNIQLIE